MDIRRGPSEEKLNARLDLKRWDFQTLLDAEYLNDEIINKYMRLIQERNAADPNLPVICASTSFRYLAIQEKGLSYALKTFKEDFRGKELILFPIHNAQISHWSLVVVEISTKTVHYLNSIKFHRIHHRAPRVIKKYMEKYYADRGETVTFTFNRRQDAPDQGNGYDCGVFVCQYAERIARRSPLNFRQKDLDRVGAREMMINELLEGKINTAWQMVNWDGVEETKRICKELEKKGTGSRHGAERKCQKKNRKIEYQ